MVDYTKKNIAEYHREQSRDDQNRRHYENLRYREQKDFFTTVNKREERESKAQSSMDLAVKKGEISTDIVQKNFDLAPGYSDLDFEDYVRRENIRLQSLQVELDMRAEDKHKRYAVEKKSVLLAATVSILHEKLSNKEARQKHEDSKEMESLKNELSKDFETHKHNLNAGHSVTPNSEIMTAEELEAASQRLRRENSAATDKQEKDDFIKNG